MVKIMEDPIKMDDLGGFPIFSEPSILDLLFLTEKTPKRQLKVWPFSAS